VESGNDKKMGFVPVTNPEQYKGKEGLVEIPPGHMLIFFENLVHLVLGGKSKFTQYRQFTAAILKNDQEPYFPNILELLNTQACMPLKSLQLPPTFPKFWLVNHVPKLVEFAKGLIPELRREYTPKSGKNKGKTFVIPVQKWPSLQDLGATYPDYTEEEKQAHLPQPI